MVAVAGGRAPGRISALLGAAGATRAAYSVLRKRPPGGAVLWERKNYAGRIVDLHAGLATATGTALAAVTAPGLPARTRAAGALAVLAAGGVVRTTTCSVPVIHAADFGPTSLPCGTRRSPLGR